LRRLVTTQSSQIGSINPEGKAQGQGLLTSMSQ